MNKIKKGQYVVLHVLLTISMIFFGFFFATMTDKVFAVGIEDLLITEVCHDGETIEIPIGELGDHILHGDSVGVCDVEDESDEEDEDFEAIICLNGEVFAVFSEEDLDFYISEGGVEGECLDDDYEVIICVDGGIYIAFSEEELELYLDRGGVEGECSGGDGDDDTGGGGNGDDDTDDDGGDGGGDGDDDTGGGGNGDDDTDDDGGDTGGGGNGGGGAILQSVGTYRGGFGGSGEVLGVSTDCGRYLNDYLRINQNNNSNEVMRLQSFLNEHGIYVPITGYFGPLTHNAVNRLQTNYSVDILEPWATIGYGDGRTPTGWVYKTTRYKINNLVCPGSEEFPLLP